MPGAGGDGRDYGLRFDLFGDQLTLRLNHYENALCPPRASNQINQVRDTFFNIEPRVLALDPTAPTINVTAGHKRGYRTAGRPHDFIRPDFSSQGYGAELNFSPTRSWNIRLNGARSEAVESHIGAPWYAWRDARLPVWTAVVAKNGARDPAGQPVTGKTAPFSASGHTSATEFIFPTGLDGQGAYLTHGRRSRRRVDR